MIRFSLGLIIAPLLMSQIALEANREYATRESRARAAAEMDFPRRPQIEQTGRLVASLEIRPGDTVADIGSGVGYLLPYLVAAVGPTGHVFAEDIYDDFLANMRRKVRTNGWSNVSTVLGGEKDPRLPANRLDVALVLDTYHHLNYPGELLRAVWRALKPGGRLIVVDFYNSRPHPGSSPKGLKVHIRADQDEVIREVTGEGFHLQRSFDHLPYEYVLVFRRP